MPELVVGREAELAALSSLLGATGLRVAVLTGDPGCGKSTLVEAVVQRARSVDHLVLRAQPREFERDLAFSALADLLEPVQDLQAVPLPAPQRTALRAALLLDDGDGPADPRAVAAGLRTVIAHLAERCPVLVAVDDTQWLDTATSQVLRHAVRRLVDVPVALLVATRPVPATADWPTGDDGGRVDLALSGLTEAALFHLIRDRLRQRLGRDTLRRVARASGGNPLYALELARSLAHPDRTVGRPDADDPFTASLDTLVGATVHALPVSTRRVLLAAALVGDPTPDRLGAACDLGERPLHHSLDEAARAEVARVDGGRVRFRHPLLAAAVVAAAGPEDRRAMHAALAEHETDVEARARHLAHAADGPDAALAQQLAGAADHARQRGGLDAARELLAMAVSSIPGDDRSGHAFRLKLAAWALHDGDPETARQILAPLVREENEIGGRAHVLLARIALFSGSSASVGFHARAGLALAGGDALLRADAMLALAETFDDVDACLRHAVVAQEVLAQAAPSSDRDRLLVLAQQAEGSLRLLRGDASGTGLLEEAAAREGSSVPELVSTSAAFALAQELLFANRLTEARDVPTRLLQLARDSGDEASEPIILLNLGHLEVRAGRFQASEAYTR
ncbi:MAG TPA: AAA family ATPase, partial [Actinomycetes bacterium]